MNVIARLAGAPISWGVCEVPGWGPALERERVLREMSELGLRATELGPEGYLPENSNELGGLLKRFDLRLVGGFVPLVLHDPNQADTTIAMTQHAAAHFAGAGGTEFVTAMVASVDWAPRFDLDDAGWKHAAMMLGIIEEIVEANGLTQSVHPHLGTLLEKPDDVKELLERTDVRWCFDTGHLLIGGYDPFDFLADAGDRIQHVHLKDTVLDLARPVANGEWSIMQGVQRGMFCALGRGDVPIGKIVEALEHLGYTGWYVLEQDTALSTESPSMGQGPKLDVQGSIDYLRSVEAELGLTSAKKSASETKQA